MRCFQDRLSKDWKDTLDKNHPYTKSDNKTSRWRENARKKITRESPGTEVPFTHIINYLILDGALKSAIARRNKSNFDDAKKAYENEFKANRILLASYSHLQKLALRGDEIFASPAPVVKEKVLTVKASKSMREVFHSGFTTFVPRQDRITSPASSAPSSSPSQQLNYNP